MKNAYVLSVLAVALLVPQRGRAHCDTMDGPVVKAGAQALATGKVAPVLAWVQAKDEDEIRTAFAQTVAVRKLGPAARELADRYFFETLVRVHRAGEGAPYTGLKAAGTGHDPALAAADRGIETGELKPVAKLLTEGVHRGLSERFARLRALKAPADDVARGRQWVAAYVAYVHYVAGIHRAVVAQAAEPEGHAEPHER